MGKKESLTISIPITEELIIKEGNFFKKDVFEINREFELRIESSGFHTLGIATIELNEFNHLIISRINQPKVAI